MMFGKVGRPPEDRFSRQCEIFKAVTPLILSVGARRLTMHQAARAACLSVGGLYHYFRTKRELVLFGLQPETLNQMCQDFHEEYGLLAARDPREYLEVYISFGVQQVGYARPAIHAAIELGMGTFWALLDSNLNTATAGFGNIVRMISPKISDESIGLLERSLKRTLLGTCLDRDGTAATLRHEIYAVFSEHTAVQFAFE